MRKILSIGVILFLITTIGTAYAEEVVETIKLPFPETSTYLGYTCIYAQGQPFEDSDPNTLTYNCQFRALPPEGFEFNELGVWEEKIIGIPEEEVDPEFLKPTDQPKPKTVFEIEIVKLQEHLEEDGYLPSHDAQLLRALLSLQEECELGTEQGAPIQNYELFTIASFEPYTHTDLGTQYILKKIELAIQLCESQKILKNKVLGDQYLHIPGKDDVKKKLWTTNATLPEDVQAKYDEAKMFDYFSQKTKNDAEEYKCTKEGRARGLGFDCKVEEDQVIPETTISTQGQAIKNKYKAYLETGITDIPEQEPDAEPDQASIARQYLKAAGYSNEQIDAAIEAMEDESNE